MGKVFLVIGSIIVIIVAIWFLLWNRPVPPPISVTWRQSLLYSGKVMKLYNESENSALSLVVTGKDSKDSSSVVLTISAGSTKELGVLEMNWNWQTGETYQIKATGYGLPIIGTVP